MSLTQPVSTWLEPTVCIGDVMHARTQPVRNQFRYPLFYLRLPLSKLSTLNIPGLAINKTGLCQILNRDHGPQDGTPLLPWVRSILETRDLASLADDGEIVLQTMPRILGYTFNPVSFFFCYDASALLRAVICEVSNTFGERHNYLVSHENADPILPHQWLTARKVFQVSPFFPLTGHYRFRFGGTPSNPIAMIDYRSEEDDFAAQSADCVDFEGRRRNRHHDDSTAAEFAGGQGNALSVVSGACSNHAAGAFFRREVCHLVIGASQLETEDALEVFAL